MHQTLSVNQCTMPQQHLITNHLREKLHNGETMESTHTEFLDIPELREASSVANVFPPMENHYLLSLGQMCN
jgi:hypothetical protein